MDQFKFRAYNKNRKAWDYFTPSNLPMYIQTLTFHNLEGNKYCLSTQLFDLKEKEVFHKDVLQDKMTGLKVVVEYGEYETRVGTGYGWYLALLEGGAAYTPLPKTLETYELIGNVIIDYED